MRPLYRKYYASSEEEARQQFIQRNPAISSAEEEKEEAQRPTTVPNFAPARTGSTLPQPFFKHRSKAPGIIRQPTVGTKYVDNLKDNKLSHEERRVREEVTPGGSDNANVRRSFDEDLKFDDPEVALAGMNDAFDKWTHARREGIDAFPFVMMGAPQTLHKDIIAADVTLDELCKEIVAADTASNQATVTPSGIMFDNDELRRSLVQDRRSPTVTQLTQLQDELVNEEVARRANLLLQSAKEAPGSAAESPKDTPGPSKRAAAIAKARATASSSSVVGGKSALQRRAAVQQQKKKRGTGNAAASSSKHVEAAAKPTSHAGEKEQGSAETVLRFDSSSKSIQNVVASALRQGLVQAQSQSEEPLHSGNKDKAKQGSA